MKNKTIAVDLAKNVFEIGVSDRPGHVEKTYRLSRVKFLRFFVNQEPATVLMEACGSAHHWGRKIRERNVSTSLRHLHSEFKLP